MRRACRCLCAGPLCASLLRVPPVLLLWLSPGRRGCFFGFGFRAARPARSTAAGDFFGSRFGGCFGSGFGCGGGCGGRPAQAVERGDGCLQPLVLLHQRFSSFSRSVISRCFSSRKSVTVESCSLGLRDSHHEVLCLPYNIHKSQYHYASLMSRFRAVADSIGLRRYAASSGTRGVSVLEQRTQSARACAGPRVRAFRRQARGRPVPLPGRAADGTRCDSRSACRRPRGAAHIRCERASGPVRDPPTRPAGMAGTSPGANERRGSRRADGPAAPSRIPPAGGPSSAERSAR